MEKIQYPHIRLTDILRAFWNGARRYKLRLAILIGSVSAVGVVEIIVPLLYKRFFDVIIAATDKVQTAQVLTEIIVYILGLNLLIWLFYRIATFADNRFLTSVTAILRQNAFDYLIHHSFSFFNNNFTGSLVQRVNRFARAFDRLADKVIWQVIPLFLKIVGVGVVLYLYKPAIALIMLCWALLFLLFNYLVSIWKLKYDIRVSEADSKTTGVLADTITNHTTVQLFTGTVYESRNFRKVTEHQARTHKLSLDISSFVEAGQAFLIFLIEFFVFYVTIGAWQAGTATIGFFVLMQAYILGLTHRLWEFSRVVRDLYESYADAKEMVEIMRLPYEIQDIPAAKQLDVKNGKIEFKNVSFGFHKTREVLHDFSITIAPGEKIALVGPSGAGKSTIIKLLLRAHELTKGHILIDGEDIRSVTLESLRQSIGLVPQDTLLFHRTLKENIRYGRVEAVDEEILQAAILSHSDEFIKELPLGIETYVGERGIKLSGGERQRVSIARAILKNPPILVLDEATSSLDSHSEMLIQDALDMLMRGKTVIVIAHRLSTIRKMDRIVVIEKGRVVETGTHDELLAKGTGLYRRLWTLQAGGFIQDGAQMENISETTEPLLANEDGGVSADEKNANALKGHSAP
ncbi:MAG TPA: ABC transporter ATP-binding protein [Candidatus Taylorbacteria bacterium]|uniref:Xenobiotic-transporting ATPase n=1 Tax=Candidatus Kaiserbacteria bacterium GW2011_GWA2_49_56 TaxID=1618670 RepID=A0A0G1VSH7_9BACT|nr:MAG: Xenobiotic-transporting ATPase [Parcubacteria group bacterium GW2011_GWC2_48_17]KKW09421.1 MAG: Xenobiotic-transporting ATPase [Candidatus Kaiserbacteria bacterium GW2011_GWA2_49_56]HBV01299.1 ABC transporter ATP-binding protein [Candidatus Taylorbacteria bacterium]